MAKQTPILIKSFAADAAITGLNVCVVASGTNPGNVMLPGGALATKFIGVTVEPTDASSSNAVAVQTHGIVQVQSDGSAGITAGDYLAIADTSGRVKSVTPASGTNLREIVGIALNTVASTAGLLVDMLIQPNVYIGA